MGADGGGGGGDREDRRGRRRGGGVVQAVHPRSEEGAAFESMKREDAPESQEALQCACCGSPSPCRCEPAGKCSDCGWCRDHCRCFRRTAWTSSNTTRPIPSGCELLYSRSLSGGSRR